MSGLCTINGIRSAREGRKNLFIIKLPLYFSCANEISAELLLYSVYDYYVDVLRCGVK